MDSVSATLPGTIERGPVGTTPDGSLRAGYTRFLYWPRSPFEGDYSPCATPVDLPTQPERASFEALLVTLRACLARSAECARERFRRRQPA